MSKTKSPCTVTVTRNAVSCNPDPVPVSRANQDGVIWTFARSGYTFTGVLIDGTPAPTGDFGTPVIDTDQAGRSTMTLPDTVENLGDYKYTLEYTDPAGNPQSYDPTIRNDR